MNALEKRIKRHVTGRRHGYYAVTSPGIERVCADELVRLGILKNGAAICDKGGISFSGRVHDCYSANLYLRTASRVVMRVANFHAENFRSLEKKVKNIAWELYFYPGVSFKINVTTMRSRLFHTKAVAECVRAGIESRFADQPAGLWEQSVCREESQRIFVRGIEDFFTLSLDSSGELLYKRGVKIHVGKAPIRESLASAVLFMAGYRPGDLLVDPMCGTGAFSLEAAMISNRIPAGWFRDFEFMHWPCFRRPRWEHIKTSAEKLILTRKEPVISASDLDQKACRQLEQTLESVGLLSTVSVRSRDFFDLTPPAKRDKRGNGPEGLVVINPPYGRRMSTGKQGAALFAGIGVKLVSDFRNWQVALLAPDSRWAQRLPFPVRVLPLFHGGLALSLFLGRIP